MALGFMLSRQSAPLPNSHSLFYSGPSALRYLNVQVRMHWLKAVLGLDKERGRKFTPPHYNSSSFSCSLCYYCWHSSSYDYDDGDYYYYYYYYSCYCYCYGCRYGCYCHCYCYCDHDYYDYYDDDDYYYFYYYCYYCGCYCCNY